MGYSFDYRGRLCCDNCGQPGGVRKRKCPHTVMGNSHRGARYALPYCPTPAVCQPCWEKLGKNKVHDRCKEGAARMQAKDDAVQELLDAGHYLPLSAFGSWHDTVPKGYTGVIFGNGYHEVAGRWEPKHANVYALVPAAEYSSADNKPMREFSETIEWIGHP